MAVEGEPLEWALEGGEEPVEHGVDAFVFPCTSAYANVRMKLCVGRGGKGVRVGGTEGERRIWMG